MLTQMRKNYAHKIMRIVYTMPKTDIQSVGGSRSRVASPKRATNLTLSADVLALARSYQINISQTVDAHLREIVRREQERRWRTEHAEFVAAYKATVESEGLPMD